MNELPGVGDFARIVDGRCCGYMAANIGSVVFVTHISPPDHACECTACGDITYGRSARTIESNADEGFPLVWLRKIPPPADLVDEVAQEEEAVTA